MSTGLPVGSMIASGGLVRTRLVGIIAQPSVNIVTRPSGLVVGLPGQGGVVREVALGDRAHGWASDHLEPGVSLRHPDPDADRALQILACVGNAATVLDGPAAGARGLVFGKHGAVLAMFAPHAIDLLAPGERVSIDAHGLGVSVMDRPDVTVHSCDPSLLERLIDGEDRHGRLRIDVVAILPGESAGAGIGMSAARFDLDVLTDEGPSAAVATHLRFGDIVAIEDQDHRATRTPRPGWLAVGLICHGRSAGGGHGLGLVTLLTGPAERFDLSISAEARLDRLLQLPWEASR